MWMNENRERKSGRWRERRRRVKRRAGVSRRGRKGLKKRKEEEPCGD